LRITGRPRRAVFGLVGWISVRTEGGASWDGPDPLDQEKFLWFRRKSYVMQC